MWRLDLGTGEECQGRDLAQENSGLDIGRWEHGVIEPNPCGPGNTVSKFNIQMAILSTALAGNQREATSWVINMVIQSRDTTGNVLSSGSAGRQSQGIHIDLG